MLDADNEAPQAPLRRFDPDEIQRKRAILFGQTVGGEELCKIIDKSSRTLRRLKARGLPYTNILGEDRFDLQAVAAWLSAHAQHSPLLLPEPLQNRPLSRGRGRPRLYPSDDKAVAAPPRRGRGRPRSYPTGPPP
jgi:AT hook motif